MSAKSEPPPTAVHQIAEYVDEQGRRVRVFSPGWAEGAEPGRSVGGHNARIEMEE